MTPEWTREQSAAALAEGWDVFDCRRGEGHDYDIERIDAPEDGSAPVFSTDTAAWTHVLVQAARGSQLHLDALAYIKANSPIEWHMIDAHAQTVGHVQGEPS